jgi:hypothetical protein
MVPRTLSLSTILYSAATRRVMRCRAVAMRQSPERACALIARLRLDDWRRGARELAFVVGVPVAWRILLRGRCQPRHHYCVLCAAGLGDWGRYVPYPGPRRARHPVDAIAPRQRDSGCEAALIPQGCGARRQGEPGPAGAPSVRTSRSRSLASHLLNCSTGDSQAPGRGPGARGDCGLGAVAATVRPRMPGAGGPSGRVSLGTAGFLGRA